MNWNTYYKEFENFLKFERNLSKNSRINWIFFILGPIILKTPILQWIMYGVHGEHK